VRKKIICLENLPYHANIKIGSHHYADNFSKNNDVLWVSLPWHFLQFLKDRKTDRIRNWNYNKPVQINQNLHAITPFVPLPYRNNLFLRSDFYLKHYYQFMLFLPSLIKSLGFLEPDILWFTDPRHISILEFVKPKKIFYRCVDNLEHFDDVPPGLIKYEEELVKMSDEVFFTSNDLLNKFKYARDDLHYLPNGCQYDFFKKIKFCEIKLNKIKKYFSSSKLNVLYTGAIAEWFDFDAVYKMAENNNINIVLVGPVRVSIPKKIKNQLNVCFTGSFDYTYMPYFSHCSDIGIIPFVINEMTDSVNPIKLYEYSASGLPTISSAFKTVKEINGPFFVYDSLDEIDEALSWAIDANRNNKTMNKIDQFARNNSWSERVKYVEQYFT